MKQLMLAGSMLFVSALGFADTPAMINPKSGATWQVSLGTLLISHGGNINRTLVFAGIQSDNTLVLKDSTQGRGSDSNDVMLYVPLSKFPRDPANRKLPQSKWEGLALSYDTKFYWQPYTVYVTIGENFVAQVRVLKD